MYSEYVSGTVPECELKLIRDALQRDQMTGGKKFRHEVSRKLGIKISNRGPGRPKKGTHKNHSLFSFNIPLNVLNLYVKKWCRRSESNRHEHKPAGF